VSAALRPVMTRYTFYRRLGGPQSWCEKGCGKSHPPPPGFDPQSVLPVASYYTDCAIPAAHYLDIDNCMIMMMAMIMS
jgi:hypothetical protein